MELPSATADDIEDDTTIDIVGYVEFLPENKPERRLARLLDRTGEVFELTLFETDSNYGLEEGEWYLFRDAEGDVYEPNNSIGITPSFGDMSVQHLPNSPEIITDEARKRTEPSGSSSTPNFSVQEGPVRAVLDIETVLAQGVTEAEVDLDNSDHLELLCIGVGIQPAPGLPSTVDVLFRADSSRTAEYDLLDAVCEWLEFYDPDELLTYHGSFDRQHLRGRAERLEGTVGDKAVLDRLEAFLSDDCFRDLGVSGSLDDVADTVPTFWDIYRHELSPADWRRELRDLDRWDRPLDDPEVTNKDIAHVGKRYLELADADTPAESREYRALRELLRHYTAADITPVFELI